MALFRRRTPTVLKKSSASGDVVEEHKTVRIAGQTVEVRRVDDPAPATKKPATKQKDKKRDRGDRSAKGGAKKRSSGQSGGRGRSDGQGRQPSEQDIIIPTDVGRRQMLVRNHGSQTQIVILEGPVLVEHYVTRPDRESMVGNVYLAKARNVLPGMEAAFLDFGAAKNGVLYASDVAYDRKKHRSAPRIEESLGEGDEVLVQVVKDPMGAKGARLTGTPSLPGRYLVLVPNSDTHGISRRLPEDERGRLRSIVDEVKPDGYGIIVRTAAMHAPAEEIAADISRLVKLWDEISADAAGASAPRTVYEEPNLLIRVIREHFTADFRRLLIEGKEAHDHVVDYLRSTAPDLVSKVQLYDDSELGLFERYHVDDQLRKALERRVYLPSGGHLVVDRTEALTVIDVNTGKFVGTSSLEETVLQNNLEAAEEIGRQLRLRDIGGIIVIDFIDMEKEKNQQAVLRRLRETLAKDKTRTQVFDVSHLGLVEMTRKNVSAGLLEHFSEQCPHCEGRGVLLHEEAVKNGLPVVTPLTEE